VLIVDLQGGLRGKGAMQFIETSIIGVQFAVLTFRRRARRLRSPSRKQG
jgi:hypothetical protein